MYRTRFVPKFPMLRIINTTQSPLYLGIKSATARGFTLAPYGQTGYYIDLLGVNLSDPAVVRTLSSLVQDRKIAIQQLQTFHQAYGLPTTVLPG